MRILGGEGRAEHYFLSDVNRLCDATAKGCVFPVSIFGVENRINPLLTVHTVYIKSIVFDIKAQRLDFLMCIDIWNPATLNHMKIYSIIMAGSVMLGIGCSQSKIATGGQPLSPLAASQLAAQLANDASNINGGRFSARPNTPPS